MFFFNLIRTQQHDEFDLIAIFTSFSGLICALGFVFAKCEIIERISSKFDDINNMINQIGWHSCPFQIQKMLPVVMMSTQQTVEFEIFGSIKANRGTFQIVRRVDNIKADFETNFEP